MKKLLIMIGLFMILLTGCKEEVSRTTKDVQVEITGAWHQDKIVIPEYNTSTKTWTKKTIQYEENEVYVTYNGKEYSFSGKTYYKHFATRIGDTVTGTLTIRTYDDETFTETLEILN